MNKTKLFNLFIHPIYFIKTNNLSALFPYKNHFCSFIKSRDIKEKTVISFYTYKAKNLIQLKFLIKAKSVQNKNEYFQRSCYL